MAINALIAQGYQGGIADAYLDGKAFRGQEDRRNALMKNEADDRAALEKFAEIEQLVAAPPEVKAQYVASQAAQYPAFASSPLGQMPPEQAFEAMRRGLAARVGQKYDGSVAQQQRMAGLGDIPISRKPIDMQELQRTHMDERKFAADQQYRNRSLAIQGSREARLGAPDAPAAPPVPPTVELPTRALTLVDEANQAIAASSESEAIVNSAIQALKSGRVQLGAIRNAESRARNFAGKSDANSLAFADLQQTFEKIRNNYLLLAKGVQTEGDAQRAWNSEIGENVQNDNKLALQQLQKAQAMLRRAVAAQQTRIKTVYGNYGGAPPTGAAPSDNDPLGLFNK